MTLERAKIWPWILTRSETKNNFAGETSSYILACCAMLVILRTCCILCCSCGESSFQPMGLTTLLIKDSEAGREGRRTTITTLARVAGREPWNHNFFALPYALHGASDGPQCPVV
jgi:hypothetical protein